MILALCSFMHSVSFVSCTGRLAYFVSKSYQNKRSTLYPCWCVYDSDASTPTALIDVTFDHSVSAERKYMTTISLPKVTFSACRLQYSVPGTTWKRGREDVKLSRWLGWLSRVACPRHKFKKFLIPCHHFCALDHVVSDGINFRLFLNGRVLWS